MKSTGTQPVKSGADLVRDCATAAARALTVKVIPPPGGDLSGLGLQVVNPFGQLVPLSPPASGEMGAYELNGTAGSYAVHVTKPGIPPQRRIGVVPAGADCMPISTLLEFPLASVQLPDEVPHETRIIKGNGTHQELEVTAMALETRPNAGGEYPGHVSYFLKATVRNSGTRQLRCRIALHARLRWLEVARKPLDFCLIGSTTAETWKEQELAPGATIELGDWNESGACSRGNVDWGGQSIAKALARCDGEAATLPVPGRSFNYVQGL